MTRWLAAAVLAFSIAGGAAPAANAAGLSAADSTSATAPAAAPPSVEAATAEVEKAIEDYKLGSTDQVRVIVFGEDALSGQFSVGSTGKMAMPLIGDVQAAGMTITQLQTEIADALKQGYLKDPKVSAEVMTYRPFYILGEVNKPGTYPYTTGLTVQNAVATANGYTYRANTKKVFIKRESEKDEKAYPLSSTIPVAPGDTIRIGERLF